MNQRALIRLLVGALTIVAFLFAVSVSLPTKLVNGIKTLDLPAVAIGQEILYRLEVGVLVFYGGLVALTSVFRGAILGRLPIEISARGAKFAEEVDESLGATQALVEGLQGQIAALETQALRSRLNIDQLATGSNVKLDA
jgi:hypothetical protein